MPIVHNVTTHDQLLTALRQAGQGDVIALAAGNYGALTLKGQAGFDMSFAGGVTIMSADRDAPAVLAGLDLRGAANLTFEGIHFDYSFAAGDRAWSRPFDIRDSQNITITNSAFDGDVATGVSTAEDGFASGIGLGVSNSQGIAISENSFANFTRGIVITDSHDLEIAGNEISAMRSDGLNLAGVQRVQIEDNYFHDFRSSAAAGDHADFIQMWTRGTTQASTDVAISGNVLDIGTGSFTQSIFMRNDLVDRGLAGSELYYRNISVTDNVIVNAHTHGITVGETDGLIIARNTVLHADGDTPDGADASVEIPRIRVTSTSENVTISHNVTGGLIVPDAKDGWTVTDNVIVQDQDPDGANYYADVFVPGTMQGADGSHHHQASPDGVVAQVGAGASATYAGYTDTGFHDESGAALRAEFHVTTDPSHAAARVFDAGTSTSGDAITYHWTFGDGATAVGAVVNHVYSGGGTYDVTLTVTNAAGVSTSAANTVGVSGPQVLSLGTDGQFTAFDLGAAIALDAGGAGATGLALGAPGVTTSVGRTHVTDILGADNFDITLGLAATTPGAAGEVFRLHSSFLTQIDSAGEMRLYAWTNAGEAIKLRTVGANLNDGSHHQITINLSDDTLSLIADGVAVQTDMTGQLADIGRHDLVFGNPWGKDNFAGTVTTFDITTQPADADAQTGEDISSVLGAADSFDFVATAAADLPFDPMGLDHTAPVAHAPAPMTVDFDSASPVLAILSDTVDMFDF